MPKTISLSPTKAFVKQSARQTWSTALLVAFLLGGVALAVSSFSGPPAGCTPTSCPANPLHIDFTNSRVGIGIVAPSSKLTVNGMIETKAEGVKFPDGTVQTTAANGGNILVTYADFSAAIKNRMTEWSNPYSVGSECGGSGKLYTRYRITDSLQFIMDQYATVTPVLWNTAVSGLPANCQSASISTNSSSPTAASSCQISKSNYCGVTTLGVGSLPWK